MSRSTKTSTTTSVRHIAKPLTLASGRRVNPPHLGDLRAFLADCEGLPDDCLVRIDKGQLPESGHFGITFTTSYDHPTPEEKP